MELRRIQFAKWEFEKERQLPMQEAARKKKIAQQRKLLERNKQQEAHRKVT